MPYELHYSRGTLPKTQVSWNCRFKQVLDCSYINVVAMQLFSDSIQILIVTPGHEGIRNNHCMCGFKLDC